MSGEYEDTNVLGTVTILGVSKAVSAVKFKGASVDSASWSFNATTQSLVAENLQAWTKAGAWNASWELSWA